MNRIFHPIFHPCPPSANNINGLRAKGALRSTCCCPLPSASARSPANASATRSPPRRRRAGGWAAMCRWAMTPTSARSSSTRPRPRRYAASSLSIVSSAACAGSRRRPTVSGFARNAARQRNGTERGGKPFSRGHLYALLANPIYTGHIAHKGELHPGQQAALIDDESWSTVRDQLAANTSNHRRRAKAAEPSLLAGLLVDARGERLTPSHAVKKGRRYRYYVSAALITDAGTDREGWRLAAREIEEAVIRILADALTSPASLVERFGAAGMPSDQVRKLLSRAARMAAALGGSPGERAKLVRELGERIIVDEKTIIIKLRRGLLLGEDVASSASEAASNSAVELTATAAFTRRGAETKLVLPGLAPQKHSSRCDPALIKAIARGRAWFEELATGRARSLQELAKRDGISRRYIRRLIGLAFLSPELIEAILQGRQPVALSATRLTELDLPLDWTEQHKLLAG